MAALPLKDQHASIRNLFSGNSASPTTSPVAFMEKTSSNLENLLSEEAKSNTSLQRILHLNTKLLKDIKKGTSNHLSFSDLILSRYVGNIFSKALGLASAGLGAVLSGSILRSGFNVFKSGTAKLFSWAYKGILGGLATSIRGGINLVSRAGKPLMAVAGSVVSFFSSGGFISKIGGMMGSLAGLAPLLKGGVKFAGKLFGKLLWPITALFSAYEAFQGYRNADNILGQPIKSKLRKMQVGLTEALNGVLFGLPDRIARYFGAESFSRAVDNGVQRLGVIVTQELPVFFKEKFNSLLMTLRTKWEEIDVVKELKDFTQYIKDGLVGLGAYTVKSFKDMFNYLSTELVGMVDQLRSYKGLGERNFNNRGELRSRYMGQDEDKRNSLFERRNGAMSATLRNFFSTPGNSVPAETLMKMPEAAAESIVRQQAIAKVNAQEASKDMSAKQRSWFESGLYTMEKAGSAIANTTVAGVSATMSGVSSALPDVLTDTFKSAVDGAWTKELKDVLGKLPELMKKQMNDMFNAHNMSTIGNIMSGNAPSFDMSGAMQGIGAPVTQSPTMPGMPIGSSPNDTPRVAGVARKDPRPSIGYPRNPGMSLGDPIQSPNAPAPLGEITSGKPRVAYAPQFRAEGVDPRMTDIITEASKNLPDGYSIEAFSGDRTGGKGNHKNGHAIDWNLYKNGKLIKQPYASPGNRGAWKIGEMGGFTQNFAEYEKAAQEMKKVQVAKYPDMPFRFGGYFGGSNPNDTMHVDNTPGGAMGAGSWEKGLFPHAAWHAAGSSSTGMGPDLKGGGFTAEDRQRATAEYRKYANVNPVTASNDALPTTPFEPKGLMRLVGRNSVYGGPYGPRSMGGTPSTPTSSHRFGKPKVDRRVKDDVVASSRIEVPLGSPTMSMPSVPQTQIKPDVKVVRSTAQKAQIKSGKDAKPVDMGNEIGKAMIESAAPKANVIPNKQETVSINSIPTMDKKSMQLINSDAMQ